MILTFLLDKHILAYIMRICIYFPYALKGNALYVPLLINMVDNIFPNRLSCPDTKPGDGQFII